MGEKGIESKSSILQMSYHLSGNMHTSETFQLEQTAWVDDRINLNLQNIGFLYINLP